MSLRFSTGPLTLRVEVPNKPRDMQNLYYNYSYQNPKYPGTGHPKPLLNPKPRNLWTLRARYTKQALTKPSASSGAARTSSRILAVTAISTDGGPGGRETCREYT